MITITPEAAEQLKGFLAEQGTPDGALRVFVAPGGCSGLQYGMTVEETAEDGDELIETDGVRLLVDDESRRCFRLKPCRFRWQQIALLRHREQSIQAWFGEQKGRLGAPVSHL